MRLTSQEYDRLMARRSASKTVTPVAVSTPAKAVVKFSNSSDVLKLNKTEKQHHQNLLGLQRSGELMWVGVQCVTLKLGDDCRYTPDFVVIHRDGTIEANEVKGFWRDDARVKIKVAARMYPWMIFTAVSKGKGGWEHEVIKP